MLRDPSLVPLSRQHQHALALCVRIERAPLNDEAELDAWRHEIEQHFQTEIQFHFAAEEAVLFPVAGRFAGLARLVEELLEEHRRLREDFARAKSGSLARDELRNFAVRLSAHIRKEERQLFEEMQRLVDKEAMAKIGAQLEAVLRSASEACILSNEHTRLRKRSES